ncbi:MAG TPA: hypothetical protein VER12_15710 [Polyangiaceae bacterium]|nr:hypothetical protein [Polyangiaceae bacterium]HYQ29608.1 hypothetical protein [Polyangiaceae bacterium]
MSLRTLLLGCLIMAGCADGAPSLRARSAGDLQCAAEELKIYKLDERAYRVVGCEQDVVYISTCDAPEGSLTRKCTWLLDSARSASNSAPSKPPAKSGAETGCSFDAQCKGDRICVAKECVAPTTPAPSSQAAPSGASQP